MTTVYNDINLLINNFNILREELESVYSPCSEHLVMMQYRHRESMPMKILRHRDQVTRLSNTGRVSNRDFMSIKTLLKSYDSLLDYIEAKNDRLYKKT